MRRGLVLVLPAMWVLTVALTTPNPSISATPTPTPAPTPTPQPSPSPTPNTGVLSLDPTFGPPGTKITISGTAFHPNQPVQLYFDAAANALPGATADGSGAFKVQVDAPNAPPGQHTICSPQASANAPCATYRLEAAPTPSPSDATSPTPAPTAVPSTAPSSAPTAAPPTPDTTSTTAVGLLTQPPFVFFPVLLLVAALLSIAWIWWGRRAPGAPARAVVRHASTPPPTPTMAAPVDDSVPEPAPPPPPSPTPPSAPPRSTPGDESIDLPDPGD